MMNNRQVLRISVTSIVVFFICAFSLVAQDQVGKEIHESFKTSGSSQLNILNKYGDIDIKNWQKPSIDVVVQVTYNGISDKEAMELMDMIEIKYHTEGSKVFFETDYDDKFGNKLNRVTNNNKSFKVNYIVNMPHNIPVDLNNKYGSIFVDRISAASHIEVKYGNLKANDISSTDKSPMTEIVLGYSNGNIEVCSWLKLSIKYSKIKIAESKALIIMSKYSKVYVDRGSSVVTEAKYDVYEIGSIANFVTEASYTNFKFSSIGKKLHAETKYSDVKIGYMPAGFEEIKITNSYGSYTIGIEEGASYKLKGNAKYGDISYPSSNSRVNRFQETTELNLEGHVGTSDNPEAKVYIETRYGSVKLKD